jgi:hypothetical protein
MRTQIRNHPRKAGTRPKREGEKAESQLGIRDRRHASVLNWVPHPRDVFVFVARVGNHEPQS